ncbi:hypothetical protein H6G33_31180 [Calothrix sp. FACHB-1219]|uniref:hypothetical protein n=1 Tax=unclassified Calothrix TaxID=2619626 RepID=UPI0016860934|nr:MULTISPECIES: hypothetical protein [unclassified Calothrix]MBD2206939.1 hypothetical protein [Calothrix sp. FACHB-168]MBD2221437.1 hypothetical protein [Calothrix sp. FACHB-1219]
MNQRQSQFPINQSGLNYALSDNPILLNSMKVIFDRSVTVSPVSLETKYISNQSSSQSWSGALEFGDEFDGLLPKDYYKLEEELLTDEGRSRGLRLSEINSQYRQAIINKDYKMAYFFWKKFKQKVDELSQSKGEALLKNKTDKLFLLKELFDSYTKAKEYLLRVSESSVNELEKLILQNVVYLPWPDVELSEAAERAIDSLNNMYPDILTGVHHLDNPKIPAGIPQPLKNLSPYVTVYLIAHGHSELPIFIIKGQEIVEGEKIDRGSFTPTELAEWIERDGLRKDHRFLDLIVCYAALSVGKKDILKKREALQKKWNKIKDSAISVEEKDAIKKKIDKEWKSFDDKPSDFTTPDQILPMVAQLTDALKKRGYTNIQITGYEGAVSQHFGEKNPYDLYKYRLEENPELRGKGNIWVQINDREKKGNDYKQIWL